MTSIRYVVVGSVRGHISSHRTLSGAIRSRDLDRNHCASLGGGAYSDAGIRHADGSRLTDDELAEAESIRYRAS